MYYIDKAKAFFWKHKLPVLLVLLVISIVLPFVIKQALILRYICTIMMYATLAGSLNVINGYSGQTCLGQTGFFAIGAYACPRTLAWISGFPFPSQVSWHLLWD